MCRKEEISKKEKVSTDEYTMSNASSNLREQGAKRGHIWTHLAIVAFSETLVEPTLAQIGIHVLRTIKIEKDEF